MQALAVSVRKAAVDAGADAVGVTTTAPFPEVRADLRARRADGLSGPLRFTYDDPDAASDPAATVPWAARLVAVGRSYVPDAGGQQPGPGEAAVARFATADHYRPLASVLEAVSATLSAAGYRAEAFADDPRLVDRAVAVRAGLGWWGKNTLVIAPRVGPWMLLGAVATDAELPTTAPMRRDCGTCDACLPACPTGALVEPGVLDARRCISTWLQSPGDIPRWIRPSVGGRIYGCDDCLDACPPGARLASGPAEPAHDIEGLLALDDEALLARFTHFYVPRRQGRYLRRNLVVALANTGEPHHVGAMTALARHPSALIRRHAAWGLGRLAERHGLGEAVGAVLAGLIEDEGVADVLDELEAARATLR